MARYPTRSRDLNYPSCDSLDELNDLIRLAYTSIPYRASRAPPFWCSRIIGERCRKMTTFMILEQRPESESIVPPPSSWICFGICNYRTSSVGVGRIKVSRNVHDYWISQRQATCAEKCFLCNSKEISMLESTKARCERGR